MKTIVVIEDELFFRKSVCKILEKQKDFQIVGETNNGLSGAEMIRDLNPDIAIVDISMPLMNGLEMIRQVYSACKTKFILLTGYEEFDYAKQAVSLGCKEYLLKPLDTKQLLNSLAKIKEEIDSELSKELYAKNYFSARALYDQQKTLNAFHKIILGKNSDEEVSLMKNELRLDPGRPHAVLSFRLVQADPDVWDSETDDSLLYSITENICLEIFAAFFDAAVYIDFSRTQQYLILEASVPDVSVLHKTCKKFISILKDTAKLSFEAYCGNFHEGPGGIRISYEEALSLCRSGYGEEGGSVPVYDASSYNKESIITSAVHEQILFLLRQSDTKGLDTFFTSFFNRLEQNSCHIRQLMGIAFSFLSILQEFLFENSLQMNDFPNLQKAFNHYQDCRNTDQMKNFLIHIYRKAALQAATHMDNSNTPLIVNVKKYVQEHYQNPDLQLKTIAAQFYVSPQHLSSLFSQENDTTLTSYIMEYRMKKAKELLLEQSPSIQHTAYLCGFNDSGYFSKCFKKYYGISPKNFLIITEKSRTITEHLSH